jgi:NADPH:quinone reductase
MSGEARCHNTEGGPATDMRAWLMDSAKGVAALRFGEVPDPEPGPRDVLVKVRLAALNPADAFLAQGLYPAKPAVPHILGRDGVGDVLAIGPGVDHVQVGETVGILRCAAGVDTWGTLAEKVVVPMDSVTRVPNGWSLEEMAGAPLVYLTAWQALTQWADPPAPPSSVSVLLVTGASGGVGVATVQLGRSMELLIVALSRSAEKRSKLLSLGANYVFDPGERNLRDAVRTALHPKAVDLIVDMVGGPLLPPVIDLLGYGGRVSVVGRSGGPVPQFNTASLFFRRLRLGGVSVGDYSPAAAQTAWHEVIRRLVEIGQRPQVDRVVPFADVLQGFTRLEEGPMGKVLVRVAQ